MSPSSRRPDPSDQTSRTSAPAIEDEFWRGGSRWTSSGDSRRRVHGSGGGRASGSSAVIDDDPTDPLPFYDFLAEPIDEPVDPTPRRSHRNARQQVTAPQPVVGWDIMDWDVDNWDELDAWEADRRAAGPRVDAAPLAGEDSGWDSDDPHWEVAVTDRRRPLDPVLIRLTVVVAVIVLAVPFVLGFTSGSSPADSVVEVADTAATAALTDQTAALSTAAASTGATAADTATVTEPVDAGAAVDADQANDDESQAQATAAADDQQQLATEAASAAAAACAAEYEIAAGDYWIRLADSAGVPLADLLAVNGATIDTMLVPGRSICLPAGAATPSPPPTTAAPTTAPPATRAKAPVATAAPTTAAPTTAAPTTTVRPATRAQVEAIIREVWPDDLEERALEIAWRESNHIPTAKNWCCYGLFQIHWNAHRGWLSGLGITSSSQLLDARTNTVAAYTLYQRSGGFGPWGG